MDAALFHTICPPHIIHISFAYKQNLCQLKCSKPETKTEMVEKPPRNLFMCGTKHTLHWPMFHTFPYHFRFTPL